MSLRKSPQKTPAFLAACRANAKKSTGPKTDRAKARTRLNSLKHGRYATAFRIKLVRLGDKEALRVYDALLASAVKRLCVNSLRELGVAKRLARQEWCVWWRAQQATTTLAKQRAAAQSMNIPALRAKPRHSPLIAHNGPDLPEPLRKPEPAIRQRRIPVSPNGFFPN